MGERTNRERCLSTFLVSVVIILSADSCCSAFVARVCENSIPCIDNPTYTNLSKPSNVDIRVETKAECAVITTNRTISSTSHEVPVQVCARSCSGGCDPATDRCIPTIKGLREEKLFVRKPDGSCVADTVIFYEAVDCDCKTL